jgi:hypothetical protein
MSVNMNGQKGSVITSLYDAVPSAPSMALQWDDMPFVHEIRM